MLLSTRDRSFSRKVVIGDFTRFGEIFGFADIAGLQFYSWRETLAAIWAAYVCSDAYDETLREYHAQHLVARGIGARELRFLPGPPDQNMFDRILANPALREQLLQDVREGKLVEVFVASPSWQRFVARMGLPHTSLRSPVDLDLFNEFSDKLLFRLLSTKLGLEGYLPKYSFVQQESTARGVIAAMREMHGDVILKRRNWDGGAGKFHIRPEASDDAINAFLAEHLTGDGLLVEEFLHHGGEWSVQVEIADGEVRPVYASKQYVVDSHHAGNLVGPLDREHPGWKATAPLMQFAQDRGWQGLISFDGFWMPDGSVRLSECNPRRTPVTIQVDVVAQIEASRQVHGLWSASHNCLPRQGLNTWQRVEAVLDDGTHADGRGSLLLPPDGEMGVIISNPRCLYDTETPKCLLLSFAPSAKQAEHLLSAALARVQGEGVRTCITQPMTVPAMATSVA